MSLDPLAAASTAELATLINAELAALAADAQALRGLLVQDVVVTARVLPSNGLTDLLEIAGRRVAAALPPTVRPGDVLQVQVTGFADDRILVQVLPPGATTPAEGGPVVPVAPDPALFVAASIITSRLSAPPPAASPLPVASTSGAPAAPPVSPAPAASAPPAAPAASAPPAAPAASASAAAPAAAAAASRALPAALPPTQPGAGGSLSAVVSRANVAPSPGAATDETAPLRADLPLRATVVPPGDPTSIETRLAAARATISVRPAAPLSSDGSPPPTASRTIPSPLAQQRFTPPPTISTRVMQDPNAASPESTSRALPSPGAPASPAAASAAAARGLAAYAEPVALLRSVRIAVTPSNVAAATLALEKPERLPVALAALERALPNVSADPHIATLRTLLAFVGRIDPRSPALAAQVAAYVEHVVDGAEPKLATLLAAAREAGSSLPTTPDETAAAGEPATAGRATTSAAPALDAPITAIPAAIVAERSAALSVDLKQTLLAVAADPATPAAVGPSLAGALSALTAVQVSAAQTLAANPNGIAFTIPLTTEYGPAAARINVSREAPERGARLDGENFRIAFVLDTAHYGTVAIDLVTVGRDVTVDVRVESAPAMRAFRDALGGLTARLESLRYRVAAAGASVGITSTVEVAAPPGAAVDPSALVDRSA